MTAVMMLGLYQLEQSGTTARALFLNVLNEIASGFALLSDTGQTDMVVWLYGRILQTYILEEDFENGARFFMATYDRYIRDEMKSSPAFPYLEKAFMEIVSRAKV